jgi:fatty acyl-ACP thioesterase B
MWLWLQNVPVAVFENYELSSMTLKYRRECSQSDVLQSMCSPTSCIAKLEKETEVEVNGAVCSYTAGSQTSIPNVAKCVPPHLQFTHLLQLQVDGAEILRGKTQWRLKKSKHLH